MSNKDCSILVNSCDKYSDVWDPFFLCLKDYYPDCPYDIYLNTETKNYFFQGFNIHCINTYKKCSWGKRFITSLKAINTEFVIVVLDDFFLQTDMKQKRLDNYIELLKSRSDIDCIYLIPQHKGEIQAEESGLSVIPEGADYRLSTGPAIWKKERLLRYLKPIDDPWAWEFFGTIRAEKQNTLFYCTNDAVYDYDYVTGGAIWRGKWNNSIVQPIIDKHNLNLNLSIRGVNSEEMLKMLPNHTFWFNIKFSLKGFMMVGFRAFRFTIRANKQRIKRLLRIDGK